MPQMHEHNEVTFTVKIGPATVEVEGWVGSDADEEKAFALWERLLGAVRDFNRADAMS